jgi:hypothetical protein
MRRSVVTALILAFGWMEFARSASAQRGGAVKNRQHAVGRKQPLGKPKAGPDTGIKPPPPPKPAKPK